MVENPDFLWTWKEYPFDDGGYEGSYYFTSACQEAWEWYRETCFEDSRYVPPGEEEEATLLIIHRDQEAYLPLRQVYQVWLEHQAAEMYDYPLPGIPEPEVPLHWKAQSTQTIHEYNVVIHKPPSLVYSTDISYSLSDPFFLVKKK